MSDRILDRWRERGDSLAVPDTANTRIWREGTGEPVVCLHGVPTSSFLYRKMLPELASRGLEGVALDFPGLGFAHRPDPADFDYSWTGLADWLERALDAARIDAFHLVVHDIGGPIGFDVVRRDPARIRSLTVLNTMARPAAFAQPAVMRPFRMPVLGPVYVRTMDSPLIFLLFRLKGARTPTYREIRAYGTLLRRDDGGRAFRAVMAGFENHAEFEARILPALRDRTFPAQVVWGRDDSELSMDDKGEEARELLGLERVHPVDGRHLLQEDSPAEIADHIAALVEGREDR